MNTYLKYKPVWYQLMAFGALTFGIFAALGLVTLYVVATIYHVPLALLANPDNSEVAIKASRVAQGISSICLFGVTPLIFGYLSDQQPLQYLGFKKPSPILFWVIGILLLFVSMPAVAWLGDWNQHVHFPKGMEGLEKSLREGEDKVGDLFKKFLNMKSTSDLLVNVLVFAMIPAVAEELFFRGVLQRLFIRVFKSPFIGIIITAFIFSAIHGQFLGFFPRFVLGGLLGVLYWYSGSLWPGIIMHFLNNALQIFVIYRNPAYMDKEVHFDAWMIALSSISVIVMIFWMKRISHTHYAEIYDTDDITIESKGENDHL